MLVVAVTRVVVTGIVVVAGIVVTGWAVVDGAVAGTFTTVVGLSERAATALADPPPTAPQIAVSRHGLAV